MKQTLKEKINNLTKQTEMYQVELQRTQTINRDLLQEKTAARGLLQSSHFSRQTDIGSASQRQNNNNLFY